MADDAPRLGRRYVSTSRLEAFSDGVFAIAITLLVLDLAIGDTGSTLHRVLSAWPFYLAYIVSFLTIGAAWLGHNAITDRLTKADAGLMELNLLVLLAVSVLPFPTRLVAEGIDNSSGERLFVAMYGVTLLVIRAALFALDEYCRREHLYSATPSELKDDVTDDEGQRKPFLAVVAGYLVAILIGIAFPAVAVGLYCLVALYLVLPLKELGRMILSRT
jgi:uncharacterized membrane protein